MLGAIWRAVLSRSYCRGSGALTADYRDMADSCSASGSYAAWEGRHLALGNSSPR